MQISTNVCTTAGFERSSLQLAWEFTVMTTRTITNRLVSMRDDAFERTKNGISFLIESVTNNPRPGVARELRGVMTVPWYLNQLVWFGYFCCHLGIATMISIAQFIISISSYFRCQFWKGCGYCIETFFVFFIIAFKNLVWSLPHQYSWSTSLYFILYFCFCNLHKVNYVRNTIVNERFD